MDVRQHDDTVTTNTKENNDASSSSNVLLYGVINETVDNALSSQQEFIKENILLEFAKCEETKDNSWNEILNYKEFVKSDSLRQDKIENGVSLDFTESDLWNIACKIKIGTDFDCFHEYNLKSALNKCLISAHSLNNRFQTDMQRVWKQLINPNCLFQRAPVKSMLMLF